jgi:hypothetical protein
MRIPPVAFTLFVRHVSAGRASSTTTSVHRLAGTDQRCGSDRGEGTLVGMAARIAA